MDSGENLVDKPAIGSTPIKKNQRKVPRKIHKAEREKLKRDQLNELFFQLGSALDPARQNNGKASILSDATRLLRDRIALVGSLRKENASLLSESQYVAVERTELQDENGVLQAEIHQLQSELLQQRTDSSSSALPSKDSSLSSAFLLPLINQELPSSPLENPSSSHIVSRPQARYPTHCDSWPQEFLLSRNQ